MPGPATIDERFSGGRLDETIWTPSYLPAWSSGREAAGYAALKRRVVARDPYDRLAYIEGKDGYITALERRAVAWARIRG